MAVTYEELRRRGVEWLGRARHVEYLNEIALDAEGLERFLEDLREWRNWLNDTPESRFALAIAAVNWACYQEEDEGFRESFTRRLLGVFDERGWAHRLGQPIEAAITGWSGLRPREGAYRYVGLIREQAGLPYHQLPKFARLLYALRQEPGWPGVQTLSGRDLQDLVRREFGETCSGNYLCSPSGLAFVRAVCHDLVSYYHNRFITLDDFDGARGYRPGVMRLVVGHLEEIEPQAQQPPTRAARRWADPRLILDEDGRLYLQFDAGEVSRRLITCNQYALPLFDCKVPVGPELPARDVYSGIRKTSDGEETWTAMGWRPGGGDWALFDASRQFVCSSRDPGRVVPDSYFLVIDTTIPLNRDTIKADCGFLDLGGFGPDAIYAIHAVELLPGHPLPGLDVLHVSLHSRPKFEVPEGEAEAWGRYSGLDAILSGPRPVLRLVNWTEENARRFVVIRRVGDEDPVPLKVATTPEGVAVVDLSDVPVPAIGRIWFEPKGRASSVSQARSQVSFARWPRCAVEPPPGLWAQSATPQLKVDLDRRVTFRVDADFAEVTSEGVVTVKADVSVVPLRLACDQSNLQLRLPVHRARLTAADAPNEALYLEPALLQSGVAPSTMGERAGSLLLSAAPGSLVDLVLCDCGPSRRGIVIAHKKIAGSGTSLLQPNEITDAVRESGIGIGRFEVHDGPTAAATDAWYVDLARINAAGLNPQAMPELPDPIATAFRTVSAVRDDRPQGCVDIQHMRPPSLRRMAAVWSWGARVIDGWTVPSHTRLPLSEAERKVLDGLLGMLDREASLDGGSDAVTRSEQLAREWDAFRPDEQLQSVGLTLERWSKRIREKRDRIQWLADVERRAGEAVAAIQSDATAADVPDLLRSAWRSYLLSERFEPAAAKEFLADASDCIHLGREKTGPPWSDIADILLPLVHLRLCLLRSFLVQFRKLKPPKYANLAWAELAAVADLLALRDPSAHVGADSLGLSKLSPREDDRALERALAGGYAHWAEAAGVCWVGAWLGWRWAHVAGRPLEERESLYDLLLDRAVAIPPSMDRGDLMAEIEFKTPGVWQ